MNKDTLFKIKRKKKSFIFFFRNQWYRQTWHHMTTACLPSVLCDASLYWTSSLPAEKIFSCYWLITSNWLLMTDPTHQAGHFPRRQYTRSLGNLLVAAATFRYGAHVVSSCGRKCRRLQTGSWQRWTWSSRWPRWCWCDPQASLKHQVQS